jgi:RsiW-degrading membrane proteinase PrsW (M82 family)
MSDTTTALDLFLLLFVALVPALFYLSWVRKSERFATEPWGPLLSSFVYGALFATLVAGILEAILVYAGTSFSQAYPAPEFTFLNANSTAGDFFLILVLAPLIEEALKASGVAAQASRIRLVSDGPVFGASVGLGFGFLETLLYGVGAYLTGGLAAGLALIVIRSLSSVLLHGSSTGMFGYGYAKSRLAGQAGASGRYYLLAVLMHATFNVLASLGVIAALLGFGPSAQSYAALLGLFLAILFAFSAIEYVRRVIADPNLTAAIAGADRFRPPPARNRPANPPTR